ncbi:alpha/beta hydrolase [Stakelama sp. CBK3Z-3]|uniref:Alpha/beta hydrolase n=2 Tax=Stakelama flava TaxID=2860338 RepID=A0ABS6XM86_9SPHN|nr:alpha/beta hydrolase [Stakelama flava]MBW4331317.1 alpha/beta hydrolase [Stakelama flava]
MLREETAASPERRAAALKGLSAYQNARRGRKRASKPVSARAGRARLRDYGRDPAGVPVVVVPSLINPPQVLDLRNASLMRWLARHKGLRPMLVDWGTPVARIDTQDVAGHVEALLVPLLAALDQPPILVGYCLGGTMAAAAAALHPVRALAMIAAPWRFSGFSAQALQEIDSLWHAAEPMCRSLGLVPMEVLQSGFWRLDPARTVRKFERFAALEPGSPTARSFVVLEDWANGGAPLTYAAGRQMFDDFFAADLPGMGRWHVGGKPVDPLSLGVPVVEFVSTTDRIVPFASAAGFADQRITSAGHVGMVVGSKRRDVLWKPLRDWIRGQVLPK